MTTEPQEFRAYRAAAFALAGYIAIALVVFHPLLPRLSTHILSNDQFTGIGRDDGFAFVWMYWWVQEAIANGASVLRCDWIFPPDGENLTFRGIPFLPILLTYPLGRLLGPISGNNLMVLGMVVGGALAFNWVARRSLQVSAFAAFVGGALFGFCPWFVWKAGGHYNMIGAGFWATALGTIVVAYARNEFSWRLSLLWAIFLWATFWSSLVEFFMLGVTSALTVVAFEVLYFARRDRGIAKRALFFLPCIAGVVSLLVFVNARTGQTVALALLPGPSFIDLIPSAKLSLWSYLGLPNRTATIVPHSFIYLGAIGAYAMYKQRNAFLYVIAAMFAVMLCIVVDPLHIASTAIRALPMGGGLRVFERFMPFALFFVCLLACRGVEFLRAGRNRRKRALLAGLLAFAATELYPALLHVTPIMRLPVTAEARQELDNGGFCLVVPDGHYRHVLDTYQVDLNVPCVNLVYWDRMDFDAMQSREERWPAIYAGEPAPHPQPRAPDLSNPDFLREARELGIRFLLFENKDVAQPYRSWGRVLIETNRELLLKLH